MAKTKPQRPVLELLPPSPWLQSEVQGIQYWVHIPTKQCGIHIRGLARMCGVDHRAIQSAIEKATKDDGEVAKIRDTGLGSLLNGKTIFLEEVAKIGSKSPQSPSPQGGPVKVICADVCVVLISYYAKKGNATAFETLLAFAGFGIEQFIYIKVGFIPRPESVMLNDVEFLIAKEIVQVNKSRQEEARFFTNPITGECGIGLQSLSFLCGGVALKHIETFLAARNEPFLEPQQPERIVKASLCAEILHHYGYDQKPRKSMAQHWYDTLHPIVPTLHKKTNYQASPHTDRESQMANRIADMEKEIIRLRQLAKEDDGQGLVQWHRVMGRLLEHTLPSALWDVRLEVETTRVTQYLDVLILRRPFPFPKVVPKLPDGFIADKEISLLSFKSHQESLSIFSIQELVSYYIEYGKSLAAAHDRIMPNAERFQLYAVTTRFPQALVSEVGTAWQDTAQKGVYRLLAVGLSIIVIVTREVVPASHNRPWNLLSHDPVLVRYALDQSPLPADLERFTEALLNGES